MKTKTFNILLPTDFSDNAWSAAVYALKLYTDEVCSFHFVHSTYMIESISRSYITAQYVNKLEIEARKKLKELKTLAETANANTNHDFKIILTDDELKIAVEKIIKNRDIDLVIMGTKGKTNAIEQIVGSNTVHVLKRIKTCPTMVIPDAHEFVKPKQIAFPTDYNRFYDDKELKPLKNMAELYNSKIRILHINVEEKLSDIQDYNMKMLSNYLGNYEHSFHWLPAYTNKSKAITDFVEDLGIDMLAMVNYQHSIIEKIVNEPVIKKLAYNPNVPMLVIPE